MSPDRQLLTTLGGLRRQWRQRVLLESLVWIVVAVILAVLATMLVLRWFSSADADADRTLLIARVTGYALIAAAIVRGLIVPLLRRASDERFALYVEERAPELKQALLTAVQEAHRPESERESPSLSARLMTRAAAAIRPMEARTSLERARMVRAAQWSGGLAVVAALLLVLGPDAIRNGARVLFVPFGTAEAAVPRRLVSVEPGDITVPRGGALEVHAALQGFAADAADLVFRSDSTGEWNRLPMSRDADSLSFRSRLFDLTQQTEYYVESADVRSPTFTLKISDLPAVTRLSVDLHFPAYSGLPSEHFDEGGDVAAVVGTRVVITARVTKAVKGGQLHFDDGTTVPLTVGDSGVTGTFTVKRSGFYRVDLETLDGTMVAGSVQYVVDAIPDRAPSVRIEEPGRDTKVSNTDEVTVAVRASDDLGVTKMELRYRVNGGEEKRVIIQDSTERRPRDARGTYTLFLEELGLTPGDLVAYHAVARDGSGHEGSSDVYFLEVRPFAKNYRQAEQQGGGGGGGGGQQEDSPEGFVARQRDVVAGTFNWLRDSSTTPAKKRREDITTLTIAQGRLREDVGALAKRLIDRGVAATDTTFAKIQKELTAATAEMKGAEEQLGRQLGGTALPPEHAIQ